MRSTTWMAAATAAAGLALLTGCGAGSAPTSTTPAAVPSSAAVSPTGSAAPVATSTPRGTGAASQVVTGTAATRPAARSDAGTLTWSGLGGVPLGADASSFAAALGHPLAPLAPADRQTLAEHQCGYRRLDAVPGLALRVTGTDPDGSVQVISLSGANRITTSSGIALGDSLDRVRAVHGDFLLDTRFDYWPEDGHALTASAADGARWVFIADRSDRLVEIRLGRTPDVYAPEGCV